jgi:hypothetical protein
MTSPDQPMSGSVPAVTHGASPAQTTGAGAGMLASTAERDAAAQRLQVAFAEQRLTDDEFDHRIRDALTARTRAELDLLTADLPAASRLEIVTGRKPGRFAVVYKGSITRSGRWRVPKRLLFGVYKGGGRIDLRAAELTARVTTIRAIAYKSNTEIVVPPGVRIELSGLGVSADSDSPPDEDLGHDADAPVVRIKGLGYKGTILVATRTPLPQTPGLSPGPSQTPLPLT